MKKILILVLVLILNANLCFANTYKLPKEQRKKYQTEIQTLIEQKVTTGKECTDKIYNEALALYQNYSQNKNLMKHNYEYTQKFNDLARSIEGLEFSLYLDLIDTTDKYIPLKNNIPATDNGLVLLDFIYPYLKNNKIKNRNSISGLSHYINNKAIEIDKLRNEIITYSRNYETQKERNFYNTKVRKYEIQDLQDWTLPGYSGILIKNKFYSATATVKYVLSTGVLADLTQDGGVLIYIKTSKPSQLAIGDIFVPYLPVKYLGTDYTYTNILGGKNSVPAFQEVLPQEFKQKMVIPKVSEQFYFIDKPVWEHPLSKVELQNPRLAYKYPMGIRPYRSGYKNKETNNIKNASYIYPPELTQIEENPQRLAENESVPKKILKGIGFILLIPAAVAWAIITGN